MVCFHHKKSGAVLIKCGQPLVGPTSKRCRGDVSILNTCLPGLSKGKVMDIRSQSIAQQHIAQQHIAQQHIAQQHMSKSTGFLESLQPQR